MSLVKHINVNDGSGRQFEDSTVGELKFDTKPEVGSFNAVTSDAVARAVAGASGEVPQVTEGDNGKVLTAGYDAGGPSVSWQDAAAPYTAGEGIAISDQNVVSVDHDETLTAQPQSKSYNPANGNFGDYFNISGPEDATADLHFSRPTSASGRIHLDLPNGTTVPEGAKLAYIFYERHGFDGYTLVLATDDRGRTIDWYTDGTLPVSSWDSYNVPMAGTDKVMSLCATVDGTTPWGTGVGSLDGARLARLYEENWDPQYIVDYYVKLTSENSWETSLRVVRPVPRANDDGLVLTSTGADTFEWQTPQTGPTYTAGSGISIDANNEISCTVQSPTAGDGIAISGQNAVSVYHDSTLAGVGGTQYADAVLDTDTSWVFDERGNICYYAYALHMSYSSSEGIRISIPAYMYLPFPKEMVPGDVPDTRSKQVAAIIVNPGDTTKWAVMPAYADGVGNVYTDSNGNLVADDTPYVFYIATDVGGRGTLLEAPGVSRMSDLVDNGEILVYLTVWDSGVPYGSDVGNEYFHGPAYQDGYMYAVKLAEGIGSGDISQPVPPTSWTWRTDLPLQTVTGSGVSQLSVANPVPGYTTSEDGKVLGVVDNSGTAELQWVNAGTTYASGSSASVSLSADNTVVTNSVDVTSITVGAGVKSAVVQWVVASTTTLPTVVDDNNNPLKASVNNPASLTVGRTVQVSILNGTWVCAEFA